MLDQLSELTEVERGVLDDLLRWAHPLVRAQTREALVGCGALCVAANGYSVDQDLVAAIALSLAAMAHVTTHPARPPVYVTPPDLLAIVSGDVGEIGRLLVELVGAAREQITIVTPFFSEAGFRSICVPLQQSSSRASLRLFLTLRDHERPRVSNLLEALGEDMPGRTVTVFVHARSGPESAPQPHAKLLLCDGVAGYLGSANISLNGLRDQFEVGVRLEAMAVRTLEQVLDVMVTGGHYMAWNR